MIRKMMFAAAAVLATGLFTASANAAPYRVIRWEPTRICQVWDYGVSRPIGVYKVMSKKKATVAAALRTENWLVRRHRCGW